MEIKKLWEMIFIDRWELDDRIGIWFLVDFKFVLNGAGIFLNALEGRKIDIFN